MLNDLEGGVRLTEAQSDQTLLLVPTPLTNAGRTGHRLPPSVGHYIWKQFYEANPQLLYFVRKSPKKENFEAKLRQFGLVREVDGIPVRTFLSLRFSSLTCSQVIQHKKKKNKNRKFISDGVENQYGKRKPSVSPASSSSSPSPPSAAPAAPKLSQFPKSPTVAPPVAGYVWKKP